MQCPTTLCLLPNAQPQSPVVKKNVIDVKALNKDFYEREVNGSFTAKLFLLSTLAPTGLWLLSCEGHRL